MGVPGNQMIHVSKRNSDYSVEFSPETETGVCAGFPDTVRQDNVIVESVGSDRDTTHGWVSGDS